MAAALTAISVEKLKPGTARREIPQYQDARVVSIIQPSGAKSWAVRYRYGGKPRKLTVGPYILGTILPKRAPTPAMRFKPSMRVATQRGSDGKPKRLRSSDCCKNRIFLLLPNSWHRPGPRTPKIAPGARQRHLGLRPMRRNTR